MTDVIRRKIDRAKAPLAEGAPGADRGWRLALARAARDLMGLDLDFRQLSVTRASLAEVLDEAPDRALVALLDGPAAGLGVLLIAPAVTSALIEMQTMGRLSAQAPPARKPTRIDAAMVAGLIDRALLGLEEYLAEEADLVWAGGFRYASHLDDVRPLSLLLEDEPYRVLKADLSLGTSGREGAVTLVLPAMGKGRLPMAETDAEDSTAPTFTMGFAEQVLQVGCALDGVIGRLRLPLGRIMALQPDEVLALPLAALDAISLETTDGRSVARARLGQNRGMRALKLYDIESQRKPAPGFSGYSGHPPAPDPEPLAELRATG